MTEHPREPQPWPDPERPGVPLNPERDGWHWLRNRWGAVVPALWVASEGWRLNGADYSIKSAGRNQEYLGPCLTPAEVAAQVAAAAQAMLRKAVDEAEAERANRADHGFPKEALGASYVRSRISNIPLLEGDALAAAIAAAVAREREALDDVARVLHKAGEQFTFYANEHAKKGTADGDAKAATNQQWAQRCFNAHDAALRARGEGGGGEG